jgi:GDPmannose 4,6-dehydratase
MMWLMLQQDKPEDFVIASGVQHNVRDFVSAAANELGMDIFWAGEGLDEKGYLGSAPSGGRGAGQAGHRHPVVAVDPRYYRPTEVDSLLGDPTKAREKLGWQPGTSFAELVAEMVREDLKDAERDALVKRHGYATYNHNE